MMHIVDRRRTSDGRSLSALRVTEFLLIAGAALILAAVSLVGSAAWAFLLGVGGAGVLCSLLMKRVIERIARERELDAIVARARMRDRSATLEHLVSEARTPLTTLTGFSSLLMRSRAELDGQVIDEAMEQIRRNAARLNRILGELNDVDRFLREEPVVQPSAVDLGALVRRVAGDMTLGSWALRSDIANVVVTVDEGIVERAVDAVLRNAVAFGGPAASLSVELSHGGSSAAIVIEVDGPTPTEHIDEIGARLARARQALTVHQGNLTVSFTDRSVVYAIEVPDASVPSRASAPVIQIASMRYSA